MEEVKDPDYKRHDHLEVFEMTYEKITWKYLDGNIIHFESWKERCVA